MSGQTGYKQLECLYCGEKNLVPISPSDLDFEGNTISTRANESRTKGQGVEFTCKWCRRKNSINK